MVGDIIVRTVVDDDCSITSGEKSVFVICNPNPERRIFWKGIIEFRSKTSTPCCKVLFFGQDLHRVLVHLEKCYPLVKKR